MKRGFALQRQYQKVISVPTTTYPWSNTGESMYKETRSVSKSAYIEQSRSRVGFPVGEDLSGDS